MKKIFLFLAVASTAVFTSCSSDDNSDGGGAVAATGITLAAVGATSIEAGESVTFTVTDNLTPANVVTGASTLTANDVAITGATFTSTAAGTFKVKATYKNSKNVVLTSNEVTIVVTQTPTASNSIIVGSTTYDTASASMLYYLGTTAGSINVFVANPYKEVGTGEDATYPNDVYVYFTSAQVDTQYIDWPVTGAYGYAADTAAGMKAFDANIILNGAEVLPVETTSNVSMNLSAIVNTSDARTWAFTYSVLMADNTTANGEYHGAYAFQNASQAKAAKTNVNAVSKVSNAQIKANLAKVMSMKK